MCIRDSHNLYANNGAATKGVNDDTADSFSEDKVSKIIEVLRNGTSVSYTHLDVYKRQHMESLIETMRKILEQDGEVLDLIPQTKQEISEEHIEGGMNME